MNAERERRPIDLSAEEFWEKWGPADAPARTRSDYMVDLERVVLTRIQERTVADAGTVHAGGATATNEAAAFDWSDADRVVVKRVDAIAVYRNAEGDLVIRQEGRGGTDACVTVPARYAYTLIEALQRQLKGPMFAEPQRS
jgi:hypothetical protein